MKLDKKFRTIATVLTCIAIVPALFMIYVTGSLLLWFTTVPPDVSSRDSLLAIWMGLIAALLALTFFTCLLFALRTRRIIPSLAIGMLGWLILILIPSIWFTFYLLYPFVSVLIATLSLIGIISLIQDSKLPALHKKKRSAKKK